MQSWRCRTEIVFGETGRRSLATAIRQGRALVLVDKAVLTPLADAGLHPHAYLGLRDCDVIEELEPLSDPLHEVARIAPTAESATSITAIGGGSILDTAKLLRLQLDRPHDFARSVRRPGRGRFAFFGCEPATRGGSVSKLRPLHAIPTTLGTAAEVSPVACFGAPGAKHIGAGPELEPTTALLDPRFTESLPRDLQVRGAIEVALRLIGPLLGGPSTVALADREAFAQLERVIGIIELLRSQHELDIDERQDLALRSIQTRIGFSLLGRSPFCSQLWYLSTTLADVAGISKVAANLAVLNALAHLHDDAEATYACRRSLQIVAEAVGASHPPAIVDRVGRELLVDERITFDPSKAAAAAFDHWGNGLPALPGMGLAKLHAIFEFIKLSEQERTCSTMQQR